MKGFMKLRKPEKVKFPFRNWNSGLTLNPNLLLPFFREFSGLNLNSWNLTG